MARHLTMQEMNKLLLDHLYDQTTLTEIAALHKSSVGNIHHKLRALVVGLGFHHATRDPHIISAAYYRRDARNHAWQDTPTAFYHNERGLTPKENY